jgi:uncharacterized phage-associated protein
MGKRPQRGCGVEVEAIMDNGSGTWGGYSASTVANYFLGLGRRDGIPIDPMKLQKLVYLAHGWSLAFLKRRLIKEPIEAWRYGPVVPALYRMFQKFGASPITENAPEAAPESQQRLDEETKSLLDTVWEKYGKLSSIQLSMLTHEPGYAWDLATRSGGPLPWSNSVIPDGLIEYEFARRQQEAS